MTFLLKLTLIFVAAPKSELMWMTSSEALRVAVATVSPICPLIPAVVLLIVAAGRPCFGV